MKAYKKIIIVGLIGAMTLSMAACSQEKEVESKENVKSEETVSGTEADKETSEETTEETSENNVVYEFHEIYEKPELLKEFTDMDANYEDYLKSRPLRALFLDEDDNIANEIDVYTLPEAEDSTALYIYQENKKVVNAKLDAFNGEINTEEYDYDTLLYNYDNNIENQMKEADFSYDLLKEAEEAEKELKEKFEEKDLNEFNKFLDVYTPVQKYLRKDTDKTLEVYAIVSEAGYTASNTINLVVKDNKIEKLYVDQISKPINDPFKILKGDK